jgi:hypothetical protein
MIVYAPSYAGLVQALKISSIKDLTVISSNKDIVLFCAQFSISHIDLKLKRPTRFREFVKQKNQFDFFSEKIKNEIVLFCFYSFDLMGLYLMYKLNTHNTVFFLNKDHFYPKTTLTELLSKKTFYSLFDMLLLSILLKMKVRYFSITGSNRFLGVPIDKLSTDFHQLDATVDCLIYEKNKQEIRELINLPKNSIIFIDEGSNHFSIPESVIQKLKVLNQNNSLYIKPHPNYPLSHPGLYNFNFISKNIPIETLIGKDILIIGISSTSLLDETVKCKKMSLIHLVEWKTDRNKTNAIKILQNLISSERIYLPFDISEIQM